MRTPLRAGVVALFVLLPVMLVACGDDDDDGGGGGGGDSASEVEQPYVDVFVEDMTGNEAFAATEGEAECFGLRLVRVFGAEELRDQGVSPDEFIQSEAFADLDVDVPDDARDQVRSAFTECFDDLAGTFGGAFGAEAGVDAHCLTDNVDEDELAGAVADLVLEGDADALEEALLEDVSPECAEELLISRAVEDGTIPEEDAPCIANELDDEVSLRIFQLGFTGEEPGSIDAAALEEAFITCAIG
jgi:hypothetical protein